MFTASVILAGLALSPVPLESLSARAIIEKAHEAAGGAAWRRAVTNVMRGEATLYRAHLCVWPEPVHRNHA